MADPQYLRELPGNEERRAALVQSLTHAANLISNRASQWYGARLECRDATTAFVACEHARALRELAQRLCDHGRLSSDGTCRYCDAVMATSPDAE